MMEGTVRWAPYGCPQPPTVRRTKGRLRTHGPTVCQIFQGRSSEFNWLRPIQLTLRRNTSALTIPQINARLPYPPHYSSQQAKG